MHKTNAHWTIQKTGDMGVTQDCTAMLQPGSLSLCADTHWQGDFGTGHCVALYTCPSVSLSHWLKLSGTSWGLQWPQAKISVSSRAGTH